MAPLVPLASSPVWIPCGGPGHHRHALPTAGEFAVWTGAGYLPICDAECLPVALAWIVAAVSE